MKLLIFALLLLTLIPHPQDLESKIKTFRNNKRFSVKYDKFRDDTHLSVGPFFVGGTKAYIGRGFQLEMSAHIFLQKKPAKDVYLQFTAKGRNWTFLKNSEMFVLVDGERMQYGEGDLDSEIRRGGVRESVVFQIPADQFLKLSQATSAELKIGNVELTLKDEHKEAFRDLLSLSK